MPNLDLNKISDFERLTGSAVGILAQFSNGQQDWNISEGSYRRKSNPTPVLFHVFQSAVSYNAALRQIADSGGRRKVKFKFPYRDGQTTDDLGRSPQGFSLDILIHGNNYLDGFRELFTELNSPEPGVLHHPVLGDIDCVMENYEITHSSDERKAVTIRLNMIEHNFTAANIANLKSDQTVRSAIGKLVDGFAAIDAAVNKVRATILVVQSTKNQIVGLLNTYKSQFASSSSNINKTFNATGAQNFPSLLPTSVGGALDSTGNVIDEVQLTAQSPSDPYAGVPLTELSAAAGQALAVESLSKQVQATRDQLSSSIDSMKDAANGKGALEFYTEITGLIQTGLDLQDAFEKGVKSSQFKVINYVVPRLMTTREIAFANGVPLDQVNEIDLLNPQLESVNYVTAGTVVRVAIT